MSWQKTEVLRVRNEVSGGVRTSYQLCVIQVDTASDLPALNQTDWVFEIGSLAYVIDTASKYKIKSDGTWILQEAGTAGYTKAEVDALIQGAKDYADVEILGAINDLDVPSVGGTTRYIYQISQTDGKISASSYASDLTPTEGSTKLVQSNGIKTYVDDECGAIANLGAKNMCPYNSFSAANSASTPINDQPINLPAGTYILTYTQTATTGASSIRFLNSGVSVTNFTINNDSTLTKEKEFTLSSDVNQIRVYTSVPNTYSNFMIRRKEIVNNTYVPYGPTNAELNASKITMLNILGAGQRITASQSAPIDLNNYTSVGRFNWLSSVTQYMSNLPVSGKGGMLEVSYIQGTSTILHKVYLSDGANSPTVFYQRFRYGAGTESSPITWTPWYAFTGTQVQTANAQTQSISPQLMSVNSVNPINEVYEVTDDEEER